MKPAPPPGQPPQKLVQAGAQKGQARPPSSAPPGAAGSPQTYTVYCGAEKDEVGLDTLIGEYVESGANHGKKSFKRKRRSADEAAVSMYYWDDRDGPDFKGWWFGEEVGSQQVWSRCDKDDPTPPKTGWRLPWNGDVQPALVVEPKKAEPKTAEPKKAQPPAEPKKTIVKAPPRAPTTPAPITIPDAPQKEVAAEPGAVPEAEAEAGGETDERVERATDRIVINEIEATQALESVRAMMEGEVTEDSLKIVEELLNSQQATLVEAQKKLSADIMQAKRTAPKTVASLNLLTMRVKKVHTNLALEMKQVKQVFAKKRQEAEEMKQKAKVEEQQMKAEQRDAKLLEDSLPEVMEAVTAAEDMLDTVVSCASPLANELAEQMNEAVQQAIKETEGAVAKAQEAIKTARIKLNRKISEAKAFACEAKKVALTEYQALQEKLNDVHKKISGYMRIRKDHELKVEAKKVMADVTARLGLLEVEVEKATSLVVGKDATEEEIKAAEAALPPVATNLDNNIKYVQLKVNSAAGALKDDITQMLDRLKESKKKLDTFRADLRGQLDLRQVKAMLQQGLEKTQAAEEALAKTEEAETPFLKGLELEGTEAAEAISASKEAAKVAETIVNAAKSFLKAKVGDVKRLPDSARKGVEEEVAELCKRVEGAAQKLVAFKKETAGRETSILLREVTQKVVEAEACVQKTVEVSAPLVAEKLEEVETSKLQEASEKTMEAEKAAALACAEARKVLVVKQKDTQAKEAPGYAAELAKLQQRLQAVQMELSKQRKVAVQGEKLYKSQLILREKEEQMKQVEAEVEKVELLTTPIGDERPSNDSVVEMTASVSAVQKTLADVVKSLEVAQHSAQGSLKSQLVALLARAKKSQEKLDEMKEATREQRERVQCEKLVEEARAKLAKVDAAFQQVAEAEAPYLKGMEILPVEEANKALADAAAATASVEQAISEARTFISSKTLEIKTLIEAVSKVGLQEMSAFAKQHEEATEKLSQFKKDTADRKVVAFQQEAASKVTAAEEAMQKAAAAATRLSVDNIAEFPNPVCREMCEGFEKAVSDVSERLSEARQFLSQQERDKTVQLDSAEASKLTSRLASLQADLAKAKAAAAIAKQKIVNRFLLEELATTYKKLETKLSEVTKEAAPLLEEGGKIFVVASMTGMLVEAFNEHCQKSGLSKEELFAQIGTSAAEQGKATQEEFVAYLEKVPDLCSRPDVAFSAEQRSAVFEQADVDKDGAISKAEFLDLFRERYVCVHEVAITDSFDISQGATLQKLQVDEVVEAISEPKSLDQLGIIRLEIRVPRQGSDDLKGWVTTQGNQGTTYFKPFTHYAAFVKSLDKTMKEAMDIAQKTSAYVTSKSTDLQNTNQGPLLEVKSEVAKMRPKVNILRSSLDLTSKKIEEGKREHSKREEYEKKKQEEKKERKAASIILKAISEKVEKAQEALKELVEAATPLLASELDERTMATPLTLRSAATAALSKVSAAVAEATECLVAHEGKVAKVTKGPWFEAKQEMAKLSEQVEEVEKKATGMMEGAQGACDSVAAAKLGQVSTALRKSIQTRGISIEALFSELAGEGGETIAEAQFSGHLDSLGDLKLTPEQKKMIFERRGSSGGIGRRSFSELLECYSRCVKEVGITSAEAEESDIVRKLEVGEFVEVLESSQSEGGVPRVRIRALRDGVSGWVSTKGSQGSLFLQDCPRPRYFSCEALRMEDGFCSEGSKEVRGLKAGEVIEVLEGPREETLQNATRARVKVASDGATGWITVTTRQGRSCAQKGKSTYTCKQAIALTSELNMKDCKVMRKLDKGETLLALEGPVDETKAGVARIRAKAMKDSAEGWVTVRGNAGTAYIEETGRTYVISTSTPLQADFSSDSAVVRVLAEEESAELLEGPQEEDIANNIRLRGRAVIDGKEGWVTVVPGKTRLWSPRYQCVSDTAIGDTLSVSKSKKVRDLETGEDLEALECPRGDPEAGVLRLKCRALADEAVGWVTIFGEDGAALLDCVPAE